MKDRGMMLLTSFVALVAGCIGYGIGDSLARYENVTHALVGSDRLQWEVMLTGLTALLGGVLAYLGSTARLRHTRKIATEDLRNLTNETLLPVRFMIRIDHGNREAIADAIISKSEGGPILVNMLISRIQETLDKLPEIAIEIADPEVLRLRRRVVFWLQSVSHTASSETTRTLPIQMDQLDTAITNYLEAINSYTPRPI